MTPPGPGAPRRRRLTRSGDFKRAYREGSSKASRLLVVYRFEGSGTEPPTETETGNGQGSRLGVSVSRKIGDAVTRNKVKRVLREAFWQSFADRVPGDVVIVARPGIEKVVEEKGMAGAIEALGELIGDQPAPNGPTEAEAETESERST